MIIPQLCTTMGRVFSLNGKNTIVTNDRRFQAVIGQRVSLSHMDKLLVNTMYSCTDKLLVTCGLASDPCQNYGYLGVSCSCVCPAGTSGSNCETLDVEYNDASIGPNTEIITVPKTITTENHPNPYPLDSDFDKIIIAQECKEVKLTFTAFNVYNDIASNRWRCNDCLLV
ncbi:blastula protease 10-like [Penaeus japonicus]|uniref:blastula protease 10-like n=1 Tax=Penaeus japonicus TaxID=27405 RepID=UPI001C70E08F|nr:blastula protease 10-like [Penaeus japonicus]